MKTLVLYILTVTFATPGVPYSLHKYYMSVWQLEHQPQKKTMEITGRIFIDDLEKALESYYGKRLYLATKKELPETTDIIKKYLSEKISIAVNGKEQPLTFLDTEVEDDMIVCYLTTPAPKKVTSVQVKNIILQELFPEQQNMINTKIKGSRKSLLLTHDMPSGTITF